MSNLQHVVPPLPAELEAKLRWIYEEVMWLGRRSCYGVTEGMAREWGVGRCDRLKGQLRRFTGCVSKAAVDAPVSQLHHEHHLRIRKKVTELVSRHLANGTDDPDDFVQTIARLESVNIVTDDENGRLRHSDGDYGRAQVELVPWDSLPLDQQKEIWSKKIRQKVVNAADFRPACMASRPPPRGRKVPMTSAPPA